jgi:hypothetical protein
MIKPHLPQPSDSRLATLIAHCGASRYAWLKSTLRTLQHEHFKLMLSGEHHEATILGAEIEDIELHHRQHLQKIGFWN